MTDEELLTEYARTGSHAAFTELYRRTYLPLCEVLYRFCHDNELTSDVAQDTFLIVLQKAGQFHSNCRAFTWIVAIAKNTLISIHRHRVPPVAPSDYCWLQQRDHRLGPFEQVAEEQERDNLNRIIETEIGPESSQIIRLLDLDGLSYEDAAAHLDIPIGTVRSRRNRAVKKLRQLMAAVVLLAVGVCSAFGADPVVPTMARPVTVLSVHDADSIKAVIHLGYGLSLEAAIRAYGYDAFEVGRQREQVIGRITDAEIKKGMAARDDLIELLKTHDLFCEDSGESDPHGRNSSILWAKPKTGGKWIFLAKWMEERNHLRVPREDLK